MKNSHILAITNQKGGVGKTTTTINLSASLASFKQRVLLVDLDPQANATTGSGIDKFKLSKTVCEVLLGETTIDQAIIKSEDSGFDILPANGELTAAEVGLLEFDDRSIRLKNSLKLIQSDYDFILIDCPPSLNLLTVNALSASNGMIIPIQCEFYALEGVSALLETVNQISNSINPDLQISGVIRTMYDPRNNLAIDVSEQLQQHFGDKVYDTIIPRNVRLAEAPSHGIPITQYDASSRGSFAYMDLAAEVLQRMEDA